MKKQELFETYKIGSDWAYDFSLGKGDFRRVKISRIEIVNSIPCFRFENITGFWPIQKKLIKPLYELGISELYKEKKVSQAIY